MKKKLLALAIGSVLSAGAQADINDILITEYVEGSGSKKRAVELTNTGASIVEFTADDVISITDNNGDPRTPVSLDGYNIEAGETLVIVDSTTDDDLLDAIAQNQPNGSNLLSHADANFYGYNKVSLTRGSTDLDTVGYAGEDKDFSKDHTIRRRAIDDNGTAPAQNSVFDLDEWSVLPIDTIDGVGSPVLAEPHSSFACETTTPINEMQGPYSRSPLLEDGKYITDESYFVQGIVTTVTTLPNKGFFLQSIASDMDTDTRTSEGIFVGTSTDMSEFVGQTICFSSLVEEYYGLTKLALAGTDFGVVDANSDVPAATALDMETTDTDYDGNQSFKRLLERHEGMLVSLPADIDSNESGNQAMRVSKTISFNFDAFRNNMVFSYKRPNMQPNQENIAGSDAAEAYVAQNNDFRLLIESRIKAEDGRIPYYPEFHTSGTENYIRIDDSVVGMEGVISYSFGDYNLAVTNEVDKDNFIHNTDRQTKPSLSTTTDEGSFAIKVGTQNLLNLFNSPFGGSANQHGDNRGADSIAEYERQKAKLVSAIRGLDADIVGLMEIENNGYGDAGAIAEFVAAVNVIYDDNDPKDIDTKYSTSNRYVFIGYDKNGDTILDDQDSLGTDSISTGLLYRPAKVSLHSTKVIAMPQQHAPVVVNDNNVVVKDSNGGILESGDNYQRDTLAGTFIVNQTGKRLTVAVNHLKSKGSTCWEEWDGVKFGDTETWKDDAPDTDFQGACENFRVAAAVQLGEELAKIGGDTVIVGDMNSYALEDPMLVLTENTSGKTLTTARDTFIGKTPQFNNAGNPVKITKTYGYINAVSEKDAEKGKASWSYSYNDEIGSLDHLLISQSLNNRLIDATDWHINAAESPLYDYNIDYKGDTGAEDFYADDAYRSSDHDSAIMSLEYKNGETDGQAVHVAITSGLIKVPYNIPAAANAQDGDIATLTLTPLRGSDNVDMSDVVFPRVALTKDGQSFVELEVYGADASLYRATMQLERTGVALLSTVTTSSAVSGSSISLDIEVAKQDSLTPKIVIPPSDNSGGSFGIFGVLSLLGLGFLRRKAK